MSTHKKSKAYPFEAKALSELPFAVRQYVKGLRQYEKSIIELRELFDGIASLMPVMTWISDTFMALDNTKNLIQKSIDTDSSSLLSELLREEGESLENIFDAIPKIGFPSSQVLKDQEAIDDLEELVERLTSRVRSVVRSPYRRRHVRRRPRNRFVP